jgi:hypothetical protein
MARSFGILPGGSASDTLTEGGNSSGIDFFMPGITAYMPGSKDRDIYVRIKPAFDYHMSPADAAYRTSVAPYRYTEPEYVDRATGQPMFTPWYLTAIAYPYFGNSKQGLVSPLTLQGLGADLRPDEMACPIFDCQQKARNSDRTDWKGLTEGSDRSGAVLPYKTAVVFYNAMMTYNGKPQFDGIFISKPTALEMLKAQLDWPLVHGMPPLTESPDSPFARYLFGDFTHPILGLVAKVWLTESKTNKSQKTYAMHLSGKDFSRDGMLPAPLGNDMNAVMASLAQRHVLGSDQTLKIMTYQELVDFLVFDGAVPYELILQACSGRANVPPPPKASYGAGSTSLPTLQQFPQQQHQAMTDNPARLMHVQHQGQVFEVPLGELRNWLASAGDALILVKPADNAHDFMPHASSPVVNPPLALPAQSQALPQPVQPFGGAAPQQPVQPFGAAPQQAYQQAPIQSTPAPLGGGQMAPAAGNPFGGGGQMAPAAAVPTGGASPQQANPFGAAQPAAAPFGGAAPQQANPFGAAMANVAPAQPAQPAAVPYVGAAMQPQGNPFASGDEIPGLAPAAAGPSVAFVADAQPVPTGVPSAGAAAGPLSPAELEELRALEAKPHDQHNTMDTMRLIELSGRAMASPAAQ